MFITFWQIASIRWMIGRRFSFRTAESWSRLRGTRSTKKSRKSTARKELLHFGFTWYNNWIIHNPNRIFRDWLMLLQWKFQYYIGLLVHQHQVHHDIRNFIGLVWLERWLIENDSFCKQVIEESNEKVLISEESYGLVDRYLRKLDQELHKFKMELEADNRGITEILEKHSLELDMPANSTLKENRHPKKHVNPP